MDLLTEQVKAEKALIWYFAHIQNKTNKKRRAKERYCQTGSWPNTVYNPFSKLSAGWLTQCKQRLSSHGLEPPWQQTPKHIMVPYTQNCNCDARVTPLHHVPATRKDRRFKNIQIPVSGGEKKNLKHILVYSCAGGWISYTAGSMIFFFCQKLQSKKVQQWCRPFFMFG